MGILSKEELKEKFGIVDMTLDENGQLHSFDGKPSLVLADGQQIWHEHGVISRKNSPAVISNEVEGWWENGLPHKDGGPAIKYKNGGYEYWRNGLLDNGSGSAVYRKIDDDGIETTEYWAKGKLHRVGGPAIIINDNGEITERYYVDGVRFNTPKEYWQYLVDNGLVDKKDAFMHLI